MKPLLVQHHIPKTGGTSLRQVTRANFEPSAVVDLDHEVAGDLTEWTTVTERFRDYYGSLSPSQLDRIQCFMGHSAPFLIATAGNRPVRAFCVLRDPVERVISQYLFHQWWESRIRWRGVGMVEAMRQLGWTTLRDIYRELGSIGRATSELHAPFWLLFNGQTRHILMGDTEPTTMPFTTGGDELEPYGERAFDRLSKLYVVGTQERFSESIRLFADSFGWRRAFVPRQRVNPTPARRTEIDEETRTLIRAHNELDAELHAHHSEALRGLPETSRLSDIRWKARYRAGRGVRHARRRLRARLEKPT